MADRLCLCKTGSHLQRVRHGPHLDCAINLRRLQDAASIEGARDLLHYVHKDLVAAPATSPVGVQDGLDDARGPLANRWQQL